MARLTKDKRFIVKKPQNIYPFLSSYVLVDKETGVNYLYACSGYSGGLTVLLDADGKPIVTPIVEE